MIRKSPLLAAALSLLFASATPLLLAQANGSLSGTVTDKTGSVVAGAKVTVSSQGTGITRDTKTDDSGHYLVPLLPVAFYTVHAEAQGFQTTEQKDIRLQVNEQREIDVTLNLASVSTSVEVTANEVAVETSNPSLGQVITSEQVAQLPLNGRNFVQLATLTPGTTQETNPNSFFNGGASSEVSARGSFSLSVGGSRVQSTDWLLDNNDNNELTAGGISILPSIDSIEEFKVLTYNYSAEYGTRAGPTVLITTKHGTDNYHGSVFEYFRNTKLDAKNPFSPTEKLNLNQFGGSFGGALQKDKTFFFVDYQGTRKRQGVLFSGLVPTAAMMNGDFSTDPLGGARGVTVYNNTFTFPHLINPYSPSNKAFQCDGTGNPIAPDATGQQATASDCDKIPSVLTDPVGAKLIALYPQSSAVDTKHLTNYTNVPTRALNEASFDVRLDHNFSSKDSAFARFSYDQAVSFVPGGSPGFAEQSAFASTQVITNHGRNAAFTETHLFSDHTINQFSAGFNRIFNHIKSFGDRSCDAEKLGIQLADLDSSCPGAPPGLSQSKKDCISCGLTSVQVGGYWSLGDRGFAPFQGGTNVFHFSDTLDLVRGKHDLRVGLGFRDNQMNVLTNGFQGGFYIVGGGFAHDGGADLLLGQFAGAIHDQTFYGATTGRRWKMFRPFVQDDWRVTNSLTVNIGVAWSLVTPITEARNRQANFNFATGQYLVAGTAPITGCTNCTRTGSDAGIKFDKTAIEPRIGLAWKPFANGNTSVRAGYAIYHDAAWSQGAQGLWQAPPYYAETDNFNYFPGGPCPAYNWSAATPQACNFEFGFLPGFTAPPNPTNFTGTIQSQNSNFKQGMVQQFNLNVEHELPGAIVLTTGYAGSRSTHILMDGLNLNVGSPGACGVTAGYTLGCGPGGTSFAAPYGLFTDVSNINDAGRARYDSLQIKAETKSKRHGLYALLGYTWSRTFDSGLPDGAGTFPGATYWPLPGGRKKDWALSQINANNQFTASVLYDLPFGKGKRYGSNWSGPANAILGNWQVTTIEHIVSGFPLFVVDSNNGVFAGSGVNFQWNGASLNRPDQVGDPNRSRPVAANPGCNAPTRIHTTTSWFNPCAFIEAQPGELGNANRTPVTGPRYVNTDFSAIKDFLLPYEGMKLQFRAELFNLLNHPQYYLSGTASTGMQDITAPSFGVISNTVKPDGRVVQFALRLDF